MTTRACNTRRKSGKNRLAIYDLTRANICLHTASVCLCALHKIEVFYFHYLRKYRSRLLQTEIWMFLLRATHSEHSPRVSFPRVFVLRKVRSCMTGRVVLPALSEWKIAFLLLLFFLLPFAYYECTGRVCTDLRKRVHFERMFLYLKLEITFLFSFPFSLFFVRLFWLIKIEKYFYVAFEFLYLDIVNMDLLFFYFKDRAHSITWKNARFHARYYICIKE